MFYCVLMQNGLWLAVLWMFGISSWVDVKVYTLYVVAASFRIWYDVVLYNLCLVMQWANKLGILFWGEGVREIKGKTADIHID
jgi:hypothetical protein